jgi:hypothetical protein
MRLHAPNRVLKALDSVLEKHPYSASGRIAKSGRADQDSARVWDRLLALPRVELESAMKALEKREERLLLYSASGRLSDAPSREVLGYLYRVRRPSTHDAIAWWALLVSNGATDFREAAVRFASGPTARSMWPQWARSVRPIDDVVNHYRWTKTPFDVWLQSRDVGLESRSDIGILLKRVLLEPGKLADTCSREREHTILEWCESVFSSSGRQEWLAAYLRETFRRGWSTQSLILTTIVHRYGEPSDGRPFWESISSEAAAAVGVWLKDRELTARLGEGEHGERVAFWRKFLPLAKHLIVSRCETAVFICFDNWFAVQFVHMGHATYMFERSYLTVMRARQRNALYQAVLSTPPLDSYEHRGRFWASTAEAVVRRVARRAAHL